MTEQPKLLKRPIQLSFDTILVLIKNEKSIYVLTSVVEKRITIE